MVSSSEFWIAGRLCELCQRCGLNPAENEVVFKFKFDRDPSDHNSYVMRGLPHPEETAVAGDGPKIKRLWSLLELDEQGRREFEDLGDIAEAVDKALLLAPKSRMHGRS